ncbi:3127_t:CDS:1 [Cetraspora pellucida]|uniref:3127_t:CDS:1 n=1 Tax=Cetraspora pellucida TaxID=1433469 RepID=A0A9N9EPK1_9GLOM|nr:3127_t:CDS:1 [Cetraspora pellucida]
MARPNAFLTISLIIIIFLFLTSSKNISKIYEIDNKKQNETQEENRRVNEIFLEMKKSLMNWITNDPKEKLFYPPHSAITIQQINLLLMISLQIERKDITQ